MLAAFGSNSITTTGNVSVGNIIGNGQALTGLAGANVTGEVSFAATANSVAGANVSGTVANATFATSAGTATSATSATSATTAGTVTTSAQPNITSVGTLTSLTVTGNVSAGNVSGAGGVFTYVSGDGANLTSIAGANVTGTFATSAGSATSATTAGTVTTAAQPNITSVGTLSSLAVTGNVSGGNVSVSGFHIRSVATSIIAAGTTQGTATALTKEINVVATVSASQGVRLPTAVAGMVITITNTSGTEVLVYPATGGRINTLSTNIAYGVAPGATIQFIAPSTTQWYTVGASYA